MVKKVRNRELSERKILDASYKLFAEEGFDEVPLKKIAEEAGVSDALIVKYYGSKKGILDAIFWDVVSHLDIIVVASDPLPLRERLFMMTETFIRFLRKHRKAFRIMLRDMDGYNENMARFRDASISMYGSPVTQFIPHQEKGDISQDINLQTASEFYETMLWANANIMIYAEEGEDEQAAQYYQVLTKLFYHALVTPGLIKEFLPDGQ